jgi:hypothetical protein
MKDLSGDRYFKWFLSAFHVRSILSGAQLLAIWPGLSCGCLNPELLPGRDSLLGEIGNGLI